MNTTNFTEFPVDNASILFLSLIRPYHTNTFRFSIKLRRPICPEALQEAVNRIHPRFPSIVAGVQKSFFHYLQVAAVQPPKVQPDPGMLKPMSREELHNCAFRVYYQNTIISIELFHALTDGSGAIVVLTALAQEYLRITGDDVNPAPLGEPQDFEVVDSYPDMADAAPRPLPSRFAYQPPRPVGADWKVRVSSLVLDTKPLLDAAHRYGVTLNTLLTSVLASTVMQMQVNEHGTKHLKPVRIMVPVNLRKMAGSRTLRNCSLYSLPTMEGHQHTLPLAELCNVIGDQMRQQLSRESLSGMVSYNVRMQRAWLFRMLPWELKSTVLRIGYRFFGESNSSLTLTNLGLIRLPENLQPHIQDFQCFMTPRMGSPYGCTIMSFGDKITLNMSHFCPKNELGELFFRNIKAVIAE